MFCKVYVKCGHVGINNCINVWMPVEAENKREAARIARWLPRVKHHHKDAILDVVIISKNEFDHLIQTNTNDPYLNCHSKQEQNRIEDLYTRIEEDTYNLKKNETIIKRVYSVYKNKLVRNVKKYVKYNNYFDDYKEEYSYAN